MFISSHAVAAIELEARKSGRVIHSLVTGTDSTPMHMRGAVVLLDPNTDTAMYTRFSVKDLRGDLPNTPDAFLADFYMTRCFNADLDHALDHLRTYTTDQIAIVREDV